MQPADSESNSKRNIREPLSAWRIFSEFSNNSSVHGVKYIGERRRHWAEKTFWIVAFIVSVAGCSFMINKVHEKWLQSLSFNDKLTPMWKIPFPAVTICPETKASSRYLKFTRGHNSFVSGERDNLTVDELRNLEALAQICDPHLFNNVSIDSGLASDEIVPLLKLIMMPLNETTLLCKWRNTIDDCEQFFTEIITEEGFCYTFNVLNSAELFREEVLAKDYFRHSQSMTSENWSLEDGYTTSNASTYPRRAYPGARAGFNIVLKLTTPDLDYICRGTVQGFKILLHTPGEVPRVSKQYFRVPLSQDVVVSVKPNMITTSLGLVNFSPERRQCYFNNERNLTFFKVYTQSNCELECLANFTVAQCNCVKFSMPRDNKTKVCDHSEMECYETAEDNLMQELIESAGIIKNEMSQKRSICDCLPSCTSIKYSAEISQSDYDFKKVLEAYGDDLNEFSGAILSRLIIFFEDSHFILSERAEIFDYIDVVANCGGLLGLFMGVSILSLIEVFYFFTFRVAFGCDKINMVADVEENEGKAENAPKKKLTKSSKLSRIQNFATRRRLRMRLRETKDSRQCNGDQKVK